MSETHEPDFTEMQAIKALRMVADGATWLDVVVELYPGTEYPELLAELTRERALRWYRAQAPQRLMEVLA